MRLRALKRLTIATSGCMAAQVKVRERGPGLLRPRINAGPVTTAQLKANAALYK